ncbi:hypothetical protein AGMMS49546_07790 [Spirochaetia bacterium]|nr:hypothetical protein AGMMS49546_07790 [Spirochaetia bacterium]
MEKWYSHQLSLQELKQFIDEARNGKNNKKVFIGNIIPEASERIKTICGKNVLRVMLESEGVRHSYKKAEHNLKDDDLLYIVDIINTATEICLSGTTHQNNQCLEISKDIDEKITFVMEVRIKYGGWLALVTCYRHKKE